MEHTFEVGELKANIHSLQHHILKVGDMLDGLVEASTYRAPATAAVIADDIVGPLPTPTSPDPPAIIPPGSYMYELGPGSNSDISHRQSMMKYV